MNMFVLKLWFLILLLYIVLLQVDCFVIYVYFLLKIPYPSRNIWEENSPTKLFHIFRFAVEKSFFFFNFAVDPILLTNAA